MWDRFRIATYLGSFMAVVATLAAGYGLATYDPISGMVDIAPFNLHNLVGLVVAGGSNLLATIALWRKWGRK